MRFTMVNFYLCEIIVYIFLLSISFILFFQDFNIKTQSLILYSTKYHKLCQVALALENSFR